MLERLYKLNLNDIHYINRCLFTLFRTMYVSDNIVSHAQCKITCLCYIKFNNMSFKTNTGWPLNNSRIDQNQNKITFTSVVPLNDMIGRSGRVNASL